MSSTNKNRIKNAIPEKWFAVYLKFKYYIFRLFHKKQILEVKRRAAFNLQEINKLASDIPHILFESVATEKCIQNDFYGTASILKKYAGIPSGTCLKTSIEHGLYLGGYVWDKDIKTDFPAVITFSDYRKNHLSKSTNKKIYPIGPYIYYAQHYLNKDELEAEKKRLGKTLLVFPAHSTHYNVTDFDHSDFFSIILEIRKNFDSVRVCLYWKEILRGIADLYKTKNVECVSAGHIYDPLFLPRLKTIIELSDATISNQIGTHLGYCVLMGKPHFLLSEQVKITQTDKTKIIPSKCVDKDELEADKKELNNAFGTWSGKITDEQKVVADRFWGFSKLMTPDKMASVFNESEIEFAKRHR